MKQHKPWQFQPGQSGNPKGRPKGRRRKLTEKYIAALLSDFDTHGREAVAAVRAHRPVDYLKIITALLPREVAEAERRALAQKMVAAVYCAEAPAP